MIDVDKMKKLAVTEFCKAMPKKWAIEICEENEISFIMTDGKDAIEVTYMIRENPSWWILIVHKGRLYEVWSRKSLRAAFSRTSEMRGIGSGRQYVVEDGILDKFFHKRSNNNDNEVDDERI